MAGTKDGGREAANTNRKRYGKDFYARIGAMGGKRVRPVVSMQTASLLEKLALKVAG